MRITLVTAAAAALAGMAAPAAAEDWKLAKANEDAAIFVDSASIRRDGNMVTFTLWAVYRRKGETGTDNVITPRRANCDNYDFTDLGRSFRYRDREIARSGERPLAQSAPGSLNVATIRYACVDAQRADDPSFADPYKAARAKGFWRKHVR